MTGLLSLPSGLPVTGEEVVEENCEECNDNNIPAEIKIKLFSFHNLLETWSDFLHCKLSCLLL